MKERRGKFPRLLPSYTHRTLDPCTASRSHWSVSFAALCGPRGEGPGKTPPTEIHR